MSTPNGEGTERRIRSLRELPQDIAPPRDLWPDIEARLRAEPRQPQVSGGNGSRRAFRWGYAASLAATVAALAVGIWIGRGMLPAGTVDVPRVADVTATQADVVAAAYVTDPRYRRERAELVRSLEERLARLPPQSQQKVTESLAAIRQSMRDLEEALGRDPSNALLQELLVNTYQDEMHVLTAVQEASAAGEEI